MTYDIISATEQITKWVVAIDATTDLTGIPDNVYPFAGVEDQWAVVMNEKQIAWAAEYGTACMIYVLALQTKREHVTRNPANGLGGIVICGDWRLSEVEAIESVKANIDNFGRRSDVLE